MSVRVAQTQSDATTNHLLQSDGHQILLDQPNDVQIGAVQPEILVLWYDGQGAGRRRCDRTAVVGDAIGRLVVAVLCVGRVAVRLVGRRFVCANGKI